MSIVCREISYRYPNEKKWVLQNFSCDIHQNEFVILQSPTGTGKSSLLRTIMGLSPQFFGGEIKGEVLVQGLNPHHEPVYSLSKKVGYVFQSPEVQILFSTVGDELRFPLENFGFGELEIEKRLRFAFDFLPDYIHLNRKTQTLSGGEKQLLAIATAIMPPIEYLLLDEPLSQLDPHWRKEIASRLSKLHQKGMTILCAEHHLADLQPYATRILTLHSLSQRTSNTFTETKTSPLKEVQSPSSLLLQAKDLWLKREQRELFGGLTLHLHESEILGLRGSNGSGKTSLLQILFGLTSADFGKVEFSKGQKPKIALLPQNPRDLFFEMTLEEEVRATKNDWNGFLQKMSPYLPLVSRLDPERHPYDLSAGEQLQFAFSLLLESQANLIFLDEPTRGLDHIERLRFSDILKDLTNQGFSFILSSHDDEFLHRTCDNVVQLSSKVLV